MENLLQVGVITTTHGIRGEVKVYPTTDDAHRFEDLAYILLDTGKELCELEIEKVRYFKQFVILKFKDVDNINDIEPYKGKSLYVTREFAVPLKENEYYIADLIGMQVTTDEGETGELKDVIETGANEVYVVQFDNLGEVLIPAIHDCILDVDVEKMEMKVHLLEGLI